MRRRQGLLAVILFLGFTAWAGAQTTVPPPKGPPEPLPGALDIVGGGPTPSAAVDAFVKLAGGEKGRLVVIPTAGDAADQVAPETLLGGWRKRGLESVMLLHTRSREQANDPAFVKPLTGATAVWIDGGDQTRLAVAYHGTLLEKELHRLLGRGGVIGGTSAGAAILSRLMIAGGSVVPRTAEGFGLLPNGVIDQHFLKRNRADRLLHVLHKNPGWFGLGIDEGTAVVVKGREMTVVGSSYALAVLSGNAQRPASVQVLQAGEKADLVALGRAALARAQAPFPAAKPPTPSVPHGTLVIGGGGGMTKEIWQRFLALAGGLDARIVFIPTAQDNPLKADPAEYRLLKKMGATNVKVLHARSRDEAEAPAFLAALRQAKGVWFTGGRQWRLVDAYQGTAAEKEFHAVLERGGVIGGSSAGASIQAGYMVRGDPLGNTKMMAEGYERGLGFLPGVAIDQHFFARKRTADMTDVMARYPQLLGIGIDEATALVVHGDGMEVLGKSRVAVYDRSKPIPQGGPDYDLLAPGSRYNLRTRAKLP
jgi:cyanophycinase